MSVFTLLIILSFLPDAYTKKDYTGYKVVDVAVSSEEDDYYLRGLELQYSGVNAWMHSKFPGDNASFAVSPQSIDQFCGDVTEHGLECVVKSDNLQTGIDEEFAQVRTKGRAKKFDLFNFNRHRKINKYLDQLAKMCEVKGLECEVMTIGTSYEGRDMKLIKISSPGGQKPGIWIDAGIHAREWITLSTALIIANRLIYTYKTDPETANVLDAFDWYILPSANPDGYEFTWTDNRFWRKTRTPNSDCDLSDFCEDCHGTDPNRNWDFHWAEAGTSPNPCTDIYPGPRAFSEVEVVAMADFLKSHDFLLYLSIHAYSQLWLTPWSYTDEIQPEIYDRLYALGEAASIKIREMYHRRYVTGQTSRILYAASGSSMDWALNAGIKYALSAELRDRGEHGFLLPVEQIKPVGRETWLGIREMAKLVKQWELD